MPRRQIRTLPDVDKHIELDIQYNEYNNYSYYDEFQYDNENGPDCESFLMQNDESLNLPEETTSDSYFPFSNYTWTPTDEELQYLNHNTESYNNVGINNHFEPSNEINEIQQSLPMNKSSYGNHNQMIAEQPQINSPFPETTSYIQSPFLMAPPLSLVPPMYCPYPTMLPNPYLFHLMPVLHSPLMFNNTPMELQHINFQPATEPMYYPLMPPPPYSMCLPSNQPQEFLEYISMSQEQQALTHQGDSADNTDQSNSEDNQPKYVSSQGYIVEEPPDDEILKKCDEMEKISSKITTFSSKTKIDPK